MKHAIRFGKRTLSLTVSDDRVVGVLAPKAVKELKAVDLAVRKVLRTPVAQQLRGTYLITTTRLSEAWRAANLIAGKQSSVLFIDKARRLIID